MNIINQMKKRPVDGGIAHWTPAYRFAGAEAMDCKSVSPVGLSSLPTVTGGRCSASRLFLSSRLMSSAACQLRLLQAV